MSSVAWAVLAQLDQGVDMDRGRGAAARERAGTQGCYGPLRISRIEQSDPLIDFGIAQIAPPQLRLKEIGELIARAGADTVGGIGVSVKPRPFPLAGKPLEVGQRLGIGAESDQPVNRARRLLLAQDTGFQLAAPEPDLFRLVVHGFERRDIKIIRLGQALSRLGRAREPPAFRPEPRQRPTGRSERRKRGWSG